MRRALRRGAVLALAVFCGACDPVYSLHLHAHVTERGAPVQGAWIVSLGGRALRGPSALRTAADGTADADLRGFHHNPAWDALVVAHRGDALAVALPGRDFAPRARGVFFVTSWDATLEVLLPPDAPGGLLPRCAARACEVSVAVAPGEGCALSLVALGDDGATVDSLQPGPATAGVLRASFALPDRGRVLVAGICTDAAGHQRALTGAAR